MAKKKTKEEILEIFKNRNLSIINEILIDKISKSIKYNCCDADGYKYNLSYESANDKRTKTFEKFGINNIFTMDNLQHFININGGSSKIISKEYCGMENKIDILCECGNKYSIRPYHLIEHKKFICNDCSIPIRTSKNIKQETESIINNLGYKLIYGNLRHNITVEDSEGYRYTTTIYVLNTKTYGTGRFMKYGKHTIYNMCNYIKLNNIPVELYNKEERIIEVRKDYLEFICSECGEKYNALWGEVAYGNKGSYRHRCYNCTKRKSNLEYLVEQYLIEKKIKYTPQKRFNECKNKNSLPFDFYLKSYNAVIEVNGSQHYYENDMFSQTLSERKRIDKIKRDYCIDNKINYIEIPFWKIFNCNKESETYKNIIDNILGQN